MACGLYVGGRLACGPYDCPDRPSSGRCRIHKKIIFFLCIRYLSDDGRSGQLKQVIVKNKRRVYYICMVVFGWIMNTLLRNT